MKTIQKFLFLLLFSLTVFGCKENKSSNDYLRKVLSNLEKIESTNYYQTSGGVPVFIILDKQRIVRKVINGYEKGVTDKEITDAINLYLH